MIKSDGVRLKLSDFKSPIRVKKWAEDLAEDEDTEDRNSDSDNPQHRHDKKDNPQHRHDKKCKHNVLNDDFEQ